MVSEWSSYTKQECAHYGKGAFCLYMFTEVTRA